MAGGGIGGDGGVEKFVIRMHAIEEAKTSSQGHSFKCQKLPSKISLRMQSIPSSTDQCSHVTPIPKTRHPL